MTAAELNEANLRRAPKVVLHDHLDGGLRPQTILELARAANYTDLPVPLDAAAEEVATWFREAANSGSLPNYLETFDHTTALMQTAANITRIAREAVEDLAADGVVYAELRFAPEQHLNQGLTLDGVVEAAVAGIAEGQAAAAVAGTPIVAGVLTTAMRHADRGVEIAELTLRHRDRGVVGFDIAGAEDGFPASNHAEAFKILREALFPFTIHAGEASGAESVQDALGQGADRLGHGVRVIEDVTFADPASKLEPTLGHIARRVRDQRVALELCPSSNVQTGVCGAISGHAFPTLKALDFAVTINTDNRLMSDTTMTKETALLVENFGYGWAELAQFAVTAARSAFLDHELREALVRDIILPRYSELAGVELTA